MKEKYYVRLLHGGLGFPKDFVFGLTYEKKSGSMVVGGPTSMRGKILEVVRGTFGGHFGVENIKGRRFTVTAKRMSVKTWEIGLDGLKGRFSVVLTEHFRRLMR